MVVRNKLEPCFNLESGAQLYKNTNDYVKFLAAIPYVLWGFVRAIMDKSGIDRAKTRTNAFKTSTSTQKAVSENFK